MTQLALVKTCSRCRQLLPLEKFHARRKSADGKVFYCKECAAAYYQAHREENLTAQALWRSRNRDRWSEEYKQAIRKAEASA